MSAGERENEPCSTKPSNERALQSNERALRSNERVLRSNERADEQIAPYETRRFLPFVCAVGATSPKCRLKMWAIISAILGVMLAIGVTLGLMYGYGLQRRTEGSNGNGICVGYTRYSDTRQ